MNAQVTVSQKTEFVVLFRRVKTVEYDCALCGARVSVSSPPARILLLYGPSVADAAPICPGCFDSRASDPQERGRIWIKTLGR